MHYGKKINITLITLYMVPAVQGISLLHSVVQQFSYLARVSPQAPTSQNKQGITCNSCTYLRQRALGHLMVNIKFTRHLSDDRLLFAGSKRADPVTLTLHSFHHCKETLFLAFDTLYFALRKIVCSLLSGKKQERNVRDN